MTKTPDWIEVYKGSDGLWRWRIQDGGNHKILGGSQEGYVQKAHATKMAKRIATGGLEVRA